MSRRVKPKRIETSTFPEKVDEEDLVRVESELKSVQPDIFTGIPANKKQDMIRAFTVLSVKNHSGPLPDHESLTEYNKIIPNGADRIMKMAEDEQKFRHGHHQTIARRSLNQSSTGQIFGFIITILLVVSGIYLTVSGYGVAGIVSILVPTCTIAAIFVGTNMKKKKQ